MPTFIDLTGKRFGRLLVLRKGTVHKGGGWKWICRCDCGNHTESFGTGLRNGTSKSCGCFRTEKITMHGKSKSPEFTVWQMMIQRCTNRKSKSYASYGGRGIKVCKRWRSSFALFLQDMGERPSSQHKIERKENNGNYCPRNCVWATPMQQGSNKRNNRRLTHGGVTRTLSEWARHTGLSKTVIYQRLKRGYTLPEALTKPSDRGVRLR